MRLCITQGGDVALGGAVLQNDFFQRVVGGSDVLQLAGALDGDVELLDTLGGGGITGGQVTDDQIAAGGATAHFVQNDLDGGHGRDRLRGGIDHGVHDVAVGRAGGLVDGALFQLGAGGGQQDGGVGPRSLAGGVGFDVGGEDDVLGGCQRNGHIGHACSGQGSLGGGLGLLVGRGGGEIHGHGLAAGHEGITGEAAQRILTLGDVQDVGDVDRQVVAGGTRRILADVLGAEVDTVVNMTRIGGDHGHGGGVGVGTDVLDHQIGTAVVVFPAGNTGHAIGVHRHLVGDDVVVAIGAIGIQRLSTDDHGLDGFGGGVDREVGSVTQVGLEGVVTCAALEHVAGLEGVGIAVEVSGEGVVTCGTDDVIHTSSERESRTSRSDIIQYRGDGGVHGVGGRGGGGYASQEAASGVGHGVAGVGGDFSRGVQSGSESSSSAQLVVDGGFVVTSGAVQDFQGCASCGHAAAVDGGGPGQQACRLGVTAEQLLVDGVDFLRGAHVAEQRGGFGRGAKSVHDGSGHLAFVGVDSQGPGFQACRVSRTAVVCNVEFLNECLGSCGRH